MSGGHRASRPAARQPQLAAGPPCGCARYAAPLLHDFLTATPTHPPSAAPAGCAPVPRGIPAAPAAIHRVGVGHQSALAGDASRPGLSVEHACLDTKISQGMSQEVEGGGGSSSSCRPQQRWAARASRHTAGHPARPPQPTPAAHFLCRTLVPHPLTLRQHPPQLWAGGGRQAGVGRHHPRRHGWEAHAGCIRCITCPAAGSRQPLVQHAGSGSLLRYQPWWRNGRSSWRAPDMRMTDLPSPAWLALARAALSRVKRLYALRGRGSAPAGQSRGMVWRGGIMGVGPERQAGCRGRTGE